MAIKRVFQKEPVLSIAACLALVSSCFVLPDAEYLGYIDFRTLAILFSLMTVMAGLRGQGVFDRLGRALLSHTHTTLQLTAVLVGLCFFSSMVITNDVSLLTFVPFTFVVVNSLDAAVRDKLLLPIVCMQTIAANLGSMLTPLGNPQNLYLYGKSGMDMGSFVLLMLPYSILSLALLALWAVGCAAVAQRSPWLILRLLQARTRHYYRCTVFYSCSVCWWYCVFCPMVSRLLRFWPVCFWQTGTHYAVWTIR